ncbi:MAG: LysM peptidoglycan-binding domain-containing protein [Bacteroidales bacterium]|nr:LysM peptidoglycan-binding domain-containing protein [Bacteroidales bacterium]
MKRIVAIMILVGCAAFGAAAQDYVAPAVNISTEKVSRGGKLYYSHIVTQRQTVYSICKAYQVKEQDLYDANPGLKENGLKMDSIILIPVSSAAVVSDNKETVESPRIVVPAVPAEPDATEAVAKPEPVKEEIPSGPTKIHKVKWYEDLDAIAEKYGVSPASIMKANNLVSSKLSARQKLIIPSKAQASLYDNETVFTPKDESSSLYVDEDTEEYSPAGDKVSDEVPEPVYQGKDKVSFAVLLPLKVSAGGSDGNMDFYSGLLLAASDKGDEGIKSEFQVYDASGSYPSLAGSDYDFILGPVAEKDLRKVLSEVKDETPVVSPMDPRNEAMTSGFTNLIQAPTPASAQLRDLTSWIKEDFAEGDRMVVIYEKYSKEVADSSAINLILKESGLSYSTFSYNILEGRDILNHLTTLMAGDGSVTRFMIASEKEAFVNDVVRNLNLLVHSGKSVVLYAPSKIKSFDTIEVENFHNTNLHMSLTYDTDYSEARVKNFLMKYRALYNTEPSAYAFQGYDLGHYLITMCARYGDRFPEMMERERVSELQSSFLMVRKNEGGLLNSAVRRVTYGPDFSITAVK